MVEQEAKQRRRGRPPAPEGWLAAYVRLPDSLYRHVQRVVDARPGATISSVIRDYVARGVAQRANRRKS